jgi:Zn finger protein HypA/HybF involved in hydrogenase expression
MRVGNTIDATCGTCDDEILSDEPRYTCPSCRTLHCELC